MSKQQRKLVVVPKMHFFTQDELVYNRVNELTVSGLLPSVISILLHKLARDPHIVSLDQSPTDVKLSKTIEGLAAVSQAMMQINTKVESSASMLNILNEKIQSLGSMNTSQTETLLKVFDILQSSGEGLLLAKRITEETGVSMETVMQQKATVAKELSEISGHMNTIGDLSFPSEEGDEDDLFETSLTPEQIAATIDRFRGKA